MTQQAASLKIASPILSAEISTHGAELQDLRDAEGRRLQWDGDPAVWPWRAPILFPIVGALAHDRYRVDGREYTLPKHGFGRHAEFEIVMQAADAVTLRLTADARTRAVYPFEFALELTYRIAGDRLSLEATISNRDTKPMPASFGFHPALRWPLPYGEPREDHVIRFEQVEPEPVRRLDGDGLVRPEPQPSPVVGDTLALRDDLFVDDALIFDRVRSRSLRYGAARGPSIVVRFDDFPLLGIWTKVGSGFLCIEPWQGLADPVGYAGELKDKPGVVVIAPGGSHACGMSISLEANR